jgi:hypothetical protein
MSTKMMRHCFHCRHHLAKISKTMTAMTIMVMDIANNTQSTFGAGHSALAKRTTFLTTANPTTTTPSNMSLRKHKNPLKVKAKAVTSTALGAEDFGA